MTVLVLRSARTRAQSFLDQLGDNVVVREVDSLAGAIDLISREPVDLVLADPTPLLALTSAGSYHATASMLERAPTGMCVCDTDGKFLWANPRMLAYGPVVAEKVKDLCRDALEWAREGAFDRPSHVRGRQSLVELEGAAFEVSITPVVDDAGKITQAAALVWDATRERSLREKIDAIDKAAEELVSLDAEQIQRLDVQQRLDLLEQKLIRYTLELMNFDNFTVHLLDKKTNKLDLVLSTGMPSQVDEIPIYAQPEGNGVCGYVAARGCSYLCPDISQDSRYIQGIAEARSCLAVPLRLHGEVIGVFNVESKQPNAFNEDDRQFAEIFARHIAMALHILNLLVSERHRTTGQLASDVGSEITGPLNDIVTEIQNLVEDYIGHDELRARLNQVGDNAAKIRDALRRMTSPQRGLIDRRRSTNATGGDPILQGRRILVVDDEDVIRETVGDVLRGCGCEIQEASNGAEGIARIGESDFDLVLSDIKMPEHSGYEVFAAAKERNKDCPVILMTGFGYDPNHSIVRARREGLAAVLFKPFKVEQLLGEIRTAIRSVEKRT
ncbi:MAG: response regulator [Phycisphaerales bacterium]|nr:response regulator [Phycisphaerales bacterium]